MNQLEYELALKEIRFLADEVEDEDFIDDNEVAEVISSFHCTLCQRSGPSSSMPFHIEDPEHKKRFATMVQHLKHIQSAAMRCACLMAHPLHHELSFMNQIHGAAPTAVDKVQARLFRAIVMAKTNDNDEKSNNNDDLKASLKELVTVVHGERLTVLALAVWKAQCLLQTPKLEYLQVQEWTRTGWKSCKTELREASNAMTIIVDAVRPFLDPISTKAFELVDKLE